MQCTCRFCGTLIEVPLPDDERMERFIRVIASRACCNRCADYQRSQRDRAEMLGRLGIAWQHAKEEVRGMMMETATTIMRAMIKDAELHHVVSGVQEDTLPEWQGAFREMPDRAEWSAKQFVRGMVEIARESHRRVAS